MLYAPAHAPALAEITEEQYKQAMEYLRLSNFDVDKMTNALHSSNVEEIEWVTDEISEEGGCYWLCATVCFLFLSLTILCINGKFLSCLVL